MVNARGQAPAAQNQSSILPEPQTCRDCGRPLPVSKPITLCGRTFRLGPTICIDCADASQKPTEPSQWEQICPLEYQRTDTARLAVDLQRRGYETAWTQISLAWQYGSHGLLVAGPTGVGKSRIMWILLRRLLDSEHRNVVWLNAVRFRSGLQTAARDGATEYFVRRLVRTDVLYWDDLGQTHLTGAASEMLLHVIEQRTASGTPILATTQYSAERMEFQFERPEMGQAIRRRLNEFCRVVVVRGSDAN
jgi:IstB-like ATP binding protein